MGYGWRLGDLASSGVLSVPTVQSLRDYPISDLPAVGPIRTIGATAIGDGGGRIWRFADGAAPGTYDDDLGTRVIPTGGDGSAAWIAEAETITLRAFGATPGNSTDQSAAINNALAAAEGASWALRIEPGLYHCEEQVCLPSNVSVIFEPGAWLVRAFGGGGGVGNALLCNADLINGNANIRLMGHVGLRAYEWDNTGGSASSALYGGKLLGMYRVTDLHIDNLFTADNRGWATSINASRFTMLRYRSDNPSAQAGDDGLHIIGGTDIQIGMVSGISGDDLCVLHSGSDDEASPYADPIDRVSIGQICGSTSYANNSNSAGRLLAVAAFSAEESVRHVNIGHIIGMSGPRNILIQGTSGENNCSDIHIGSAQCAVADVGTRSNNLYVGHAQRVSIGRLHARDVGALTPVVANAVLLNTVDGFHAGSINIDYYRDSGRAIRVIGNSTDIYIDGGNVLAETDGGVALEGVTRGHVRNMRSVAGSGGGRQAFYVANCTDVHIGGNVADVPDENVTAISITGTSADCSVTGNHIKRFGGSTGGINCSGDNHVGSNTFDSGKLHAALTIADGTDNVVHTHNFGSSRYTVQARANNGEPITVARTLTDVTLSRDGTTGNLTVYVDLFQYVP